MTTTSSGPSSFLPSVPRPVLAVLVVGVVALAAYVVGTRNPHVEIHQVFCESATDSIRCQPDGNGPYLVVPTDGLPWQDAEHVWRQGRPACLPPGDDSAGPVRLAVVDGGDDGMAWEQVVWVGCP